jgi:uncharacterized membrane protein YdjX (TVP38/TMEM64 family)
MTKSNKNKNSRSKLPLILSALVIPGVIAVYFLVPDFQNFAEEAYEILTSDDEQRISSWVNDLGIWGPVIIVVAMTLQLFLIVIPSFLLMVVAVLAYGPFWGAAISVLAIFVASTVGYAIGRYLGDVAINRLIGESKKEKLELYVNKYGFWAVIITRLAPFLSNDAISFVGGVLRMGYLKFMGATMAGIIPLAALVGYFGENNDRLKSGLIWITVISLLVFIAYIIYDRKSNS